MDEYSNSTMDHLLETVNEFSKKFPRPPVNAGISWEQLLDILEWDKKDLENNSRLNPIAELSVTIFYSIIIVLGTCTNLAMLVAFCTNKVLLTTRNVLIANLAISDLLLSTTSIPLTMVDILYKYWPLGDNMAWLCKIIGCIQCTAVFLSSASISLIAVDRYRYLIHPHSQQISIALAILLTLLSLVVSLILSTPLLIVTKLEVRKNLLTNLSTSYCYEDWPNDILHTAYTIVCCLIQYCLPCFTVFYAYYRISSTVTPTSPPADNKGSGLQTNGGRGGVKTYQRKLARRRRTNLLLMMVSLVFFIAWAPIHIYLIILDIFKPFQEAIKSGSDQTPLVIFVTCHLVAMSTVCVNPLLYGWCNNNFKKSFFSLIGKLTNCCWKRDPKSKLSTTQDFSKASVVSNRNIKMLPLHKENSIPMI